MSLVTYLLFKGDEISNCIFIYCTIFKKLYCSSTFLIIYWKADGLWFHAFIWGLDDKENISWDLSTFKSKQYRVNSLNNQLLNRQEGLYNLNVLFFLSKRPQINRFQTLTRGNNEPICIHMMTRIFRGKLLMNVSSTHSNRNNILGAFTYTFGLLRSLCIKSFYVWIRITIENDLLYIQSL